MTDAATPDWPGVSYVVPILNEADYVEAAVRSILDQEYPGPTEVVLALGPSTDGTDELAAGFCDQLVRSGERSRAMQMNAGARVASGDVFWFLHADAEVPTGCLDEIGRIMRDPRVSGGFFRIRLPSPVVYRLTDSFAHYAGLLLRMRCGDHGIFCRRTAFIDAGGFPNVPLMEDVEFFRRLRRCGPVVYSNKRIGASPRRYETIGPIRLTFAYGSIATLYLFGVSMATLVGIYRRMCSATHERASVPK